MTATAPSTVAGHGDRSDTPANTVLTRISFRFSPRGATAVCLAGMGEDRLHLETWSFRGTSPRWWPLSLARPVTVNDQPLPLDDGRILLCRNEVAAHELTLLEPSGGATRERALKVVDSRGLRLLPAATDDALALAISFDGATSTVWRVTICAPYLERVARLPGELGGGVWLDDAGTLLGVDWARDGGPAKVVVVDLRDGSRTSLLDVSATSNDRLLWCSPRSGLLILSTDARGGERLGWAMLGVREPVRFPETLHRFASAEPVTLDEEGQRVLLQFDEGARTGLAIYTPARDHLVPVEIPPGCARGTAHWAGSVLRFPFSTPSQPPALATVDTVRPSECTIAGGPPGAMRWVDAHIEHLDGSCGPVEAIVYGGEGWRANTHLLMALHGGPVHAWRFEFEQFFQDLAAAGIAVVAPNQRGSSGYGAAHARAIRGAWGGPDLDDIRFIARTLAAERRVLGASPNLMLCGSSYGAFLALLAVGCEPDLWSHCVALAPFLSGPRLYHEAGPAVRELLEQLGGCHELRDDLGPRDVLQFCHAIEAKLLIVHGDCDELIPVTQARALASRLRELGKREGVDFTYLEVPGGRHGLATGTVHAVHQRLIRFLHSEDDLRLQ